MSALLEEDESKRGNIYRNIRATAASGWDFSSRWVYDENGALGETNIAQSQMSERKTDEHIDFADLMNYSSRDSMSAMSENEELFDEFAQHRMEFGDGFSMNKMDTINVIPVDLNIFLCKVERCLALFYSQIGDEEMRKKYKMNQAERMEAIMDICWDAQNNQFRDWNFNFECFGSLNIASNFTALWLECDTDDDDDEFSEKKKLLVESLTESKLICCGGIVTSLYQSGEQWDWPNCWAPLNMIIIEGLYNMKEAKYTELALKLANIWLNSNFHTFESSNKMHEKYHCESYSSGGGGEYKPQFGFGWTNGVCLRLMEMFGSKINLSKCPI